MKRKLYETPGEFLQENGEFLRRYEAACQLNLGNARAHEEEACHAGLLFGRYEEQGEPVLLFGNTLPWNLCLNGVPGSEKSARAAGLLADELCREGVAIRGVMACKALCDAFTAAHGGQFALNTAMDIMVLKELIEPPAVPGRPRPAAEGDVPQIAEWHRAFYREALGEEPPEDVEDRVRDLLARGALCVWETPEGELVSVAHTSRKQGRGVSVSGVYTPPEHRGRGYCQNTVAALCREQLNGGCDYCTLFVDKANPVSNRAYRKIGFEILTDSFDYRLTELP